VGWRFVVGVTLLFMASCHWVFPFNTVQPDGSPDHGLADAVVDSPPLADTGTGADIPQIIDTGGAPTDHGPIKDTGPASDTVNLCSVTANWSEDGCTMMACTMSCGGVTIQCQKSTNMCNCTSGTGGPSCSNPSGSYPACEPCKTALDNGCCKP
jgi:hypothetical protein